MKTLVPETKKYTKEEADYGKSSSPAQHRCGICEYFQLDIGSLCPTTDGEGACRIVIGGIEPMYGCKLFRKDLVVAATDPLTVYTNPSPKEK